MSLIILPPYENVVNSNVTPGVLIHFDGVNGNSTFTDEHNHQVFHTEEQ